MNARRLRQEEKFDAVASGPQEVAVRRQLASAEQRLGRLQALQGLVAEGTGQPKRRRAQAPAEAWDAAAAAAEADEASPRRRGPAPQRLSAPMSAGAVEQQLRAVEQRIARLQRALGELAEERARGEDLGQLQAQ